MYDQPSPHCCASSNNLRGRRALNTIYEDWQEFLGIPGVAEFAHFPAVPLVQWFFSHYSWPIHQCRVRKLQGYLRIAGAGQWQRLASHLISTPLYTALAKAAETNSLRRCIEPLPQSPLLAAFRVEWSFPYQE